MLNILLPLDGSELAERAISHAFTMANSITARITLLRIVTPTEFRTEDAFSRVDWRLSKQQAQAYLQSTAEIFEVANIPCDLRVEEGSPAEVIVETARDVGAHLLVMSTHGRGAAVAFPQGGVVSKVLSIFDASVLLVGARSVPIRDPKARYRRLLVPIDGSHQSECALRVATLLATSLEAQLTVVCISETPSVPSIVSGDEKAHYLCRELADMTRLAAERKLAGLTARIPEQLKLRTSVILIDRSVNPVTEVARRFDPDLIVTSVDITEGVNEPGTSLARVASAVEHVPVLVLNPAGVGDAFCEFSNATPPDVRTADVN